MDILDCDCHVPCVCVLITVVRRCKKKDFLRKQFHATLFLLKDLHVKAEKTEVNCGVNYGNIHKYTYIYNETKKRSYTPALDMHCNRQVSS